MVHMKKKAAKHSVQTHTTTTTLWKRVFFSLCHTQVSPFLANFQVDWITSSRQKFSLLQQSSCLSQVSNANLKAKTLSLKQQPFLTKAKLFRTLAAKWIVDHFLNTKEKRPGMAFFLPPSFLMISPLFSSLQPEEACKVRFARACERQ